MASGNEDLSCTTHRSRTSRRTGSSASPRRPVGGVSSPPGPRAPREVGVAVLDAGGNAIDAAVATGLRCPRGAVEFGLGGIGFSLVHRGGRRARKWWISGRSRRAGLDPPRFKLTGRITGPVCLGGGRRRPEHPRGALLRGARLHGRLPCDARALGKDAAGRPDGAGDRASARGLPAGLVHRDEGGVSDRRCGRYGERRVYLPGGLPPVRHIGGRPASSAQGALAATLEQLGKGRAARPIRGRRWRPPMVADMKARGGLLSAAASRLPRRARRPAAEISWRGGMLQ